MCKISFVIPCYRSENTIMGVIDDIKTAMSKLKEYSYDAVYARYRHKKHSSFRNFGSQMNEFMAEKNAWKAA